MESDKDESDFVSTVFIRYKKGGSVRTILDSKYQNGFAHQCHIDMEEKFWCFSIEASRCGSGNI